MALGAVKQVCRLVGAATVVASLATSAFAEAEFKLTFADFGADRGPRAAVLDWWANEVRTRTDGRVEIDFFWSGSLLKTQDILQGVRGGVADMGTVIATATPAELPLYSFGSFPLNEADSWVGVNAWWELHKTSKHLQAEMADNNVKMLLQNVGGANQLVCRTGTPRTAADFAELKIRTAGQLQDFFEEVGSTVISVPTGDVYTALDRGLIDCSTFGLPFVKSYKFYEVADTIVLANLSNSYQYGTVINLDTWNSLPNDIQKILLELADEYTAEIGKSIVKAISTAEEELTTGIDGHTLQLVSVDEEEYATWKKFIGTAMPAYRERSGKPDDVLDEFIAHHDAVVAKYRAELDEKGYPWERN